MRAHENLKRVTSMLVLGAGVSCTDPVSPREDKSDASPSTAVTGVSRGTTYDERLAEVAARAPGFGGIYVAPGGQVAIFLKDARQRSAALSALEALLPGAADLRGGVVVRQGQYGWDELYGWRLRLSDAFNVGVTRLDIDDTRNRIRLGITDERRRRDVEKFIEGTGVPRQAVLVELVAEVNISSTLREFQPRPMFSGARIVNDNGEDCTIGLRVLQKYYQFFLTNSHCTLIQGGTSDYTSFYQPAVSATNYVGSEAKDPLYFDKSVDSRCPTGYKCRKSDAALIQIPDGRDLLEHGRVYKTTQRGASGNVTIAVYCSYPWSCGNAYLYVQSRAYPRAAWSTTVIDKVGQGTGWTYGQIKNPCEDLLQFKAGVPTGYAMICQTVVAGSAGPGDSGAPAFELQPYDNVAFAGMQWGGSASEFVYSPLGQIEEELGLLCIVAGDPGC